MRFVTYRVQGGTAVGQVSADGSTVHQVRLKSSGSPVRDLLGLVEDWPSYADQLLADETGVPLAETELLPPLHTGRNIMCVGKNYRDHAAEFSGSGYDASDSPGANGAASSAASAEPTHPALFTKAASSVVGCGAAIDPHTSVTAALDYEAELAVVIGTGGREISRADAWQHVWGYTLINDVTARDLQRDHKQWFLGKSLDTFCPMGPWAATADEIDATDLRLTCHVNGELRQDANTADLIFDIPALIETISAGMTLRPGDIIATGTPAGVGLGFTPPRFLAPGDTVTISAPGLGSLTNRVGEPMPRAAAGTPDGARRDAVSARAPLPQGSGLRTVNGKELFVETEGSGPAVVLVHGLGGTGNVYQPQVAALARQFTVVRFDLDGAGNSPLAGPATVTGWAADIDALLDALSLPQAAVVGHSMGCLVAAHFAAERPERVTKLALLGPVRALPRQARQNTLARAETVRAGGMRAVADTIVAAATSERTRTERPVLAAFVREILLRQPAEGYAAACEALAAAAEPAWDRITAPVHIISGTEDRTSPVAVGEALLGLLGNASQHVVRDIGHWHTIEAADEVTRQLQDFLAKP
jgi:2-keto-4-pentenoate hydratase/2-oxohepta-3-ene-1,7-dioic acid hydratase in catechol pathway/pimeloyl-ACP methyl ester carboxylesterase